MNYFEQNLAIMRTRDPELAALMESDIDCSHIEVIPSNQPDVLTARVTLPSGDKILLHNMEDPIGGAQRSAEKRDVKAENASILLGFGLGYLARELAKKAEKNHQIIMCEPDPAIVKTALTHVDLTPLLESDYIKILVGSDIPLQMWMHKLSSKCMTAQVDVISYQPSTRLDPKEYQRLAEIAEKEHRALILNRNTVLKAGQVMMENLLLNFPDVLQSAGVKHLENLFQGRPGIVVAAGPSLEKNVQLLREMDGRAVIISVDTALRLLLPLGIKPDIVTTIDFNRINYEKFKNVPIDDDISLVYHPGGYYESIRAFHGPRFTSSQVPNRIPHWLMQYVEDKGTVASGTTVAHLSFFLARHLGCDPIVFIGQDLAFPKNQIHAGDLSLWNVNTAEMDTIEDIFGEPVGTMTSFKHAIYHFEKAFKETKATIIDATEAGAKKPGALVRRFRDVIDEYGQIPVIDIKGALRHASGKVEPVRMTDLLGELDFVSTELDAIQKECKEILKVTRKLRKKIDKGEMDDDEFERFSVHAERLTQQMDSHGRVLYLMGEQNYALELYLVQHHIATIDEIAEIDQKIIQQVERAMVFYPSVARAAAAFKKPLDRLIHRLKKAHDLEATQPQAQTTADTWYQRAVAFNKISYRREAMQAAQEALTQDINNTSALKLLARLYIESNRLEQALEVAERLRGHAKPDRMSESLAEEAHTKQGAWLERCQRLRVQFTAAKDESEEEAGWFYYRTKEYERAVRKLEHALSHAPTAEGYARLGHARLKQGEMQGAVDAWQQGITLAPGRPDFYKNLGLLALEHGMSQQAEEFLSEAFRLEIDDADVCERLARLCMERGAYAKAGLYYENLLRIDPNRTDLIPQIAALYHRQIATATQTQ
jgi:cytochrome c-type biogenesis protein CcmH/NrfG